MSDTPMRTVAMVGVLLGVWVLTYWLYPTHARGRITLDQRPATLLAAAPQPPPAPAQLQGEPSPPPAPAPLPLTVLAPQFRNYTVQKGDTDWQHIAARPEVFGDAHRWESVSCANPWVSPDRLKPGVTVLKIPLDPDNIQGASSSPAPAGEVPDALGGQRGSDAPPSSPPDHSYTIQKGDTLWDISKKFYGRGNLWKLIADANHDRLPNPDRPSPGVTLRIPPAP